MAKKETGTPDPNTAQAQAPKGMSIDQVQQVLSAFGDHAGELVAFLEEVLSAFRQAPAMPAGVQGQLGDQGRRLLHSLAPAVAAGLRTCAPRGQQQAQGQVQQAQQGAQAKAP